MECQIQWIDGDGNPTPDSNEAIGLVRCLGYQVAANPGHKPQVSEWYAICSHHKAIMDASDTPVSRGGRWEFKEVAERCEGCKHPEHDICPGVDGCPCCSETAAALAE